MYDVSCVLLAIGAFALSGGTRELPPGALSAMPSALIGRDDPHGNPGAHWPVLLHIGPAGGAGGVVVPRVIRKVPHGAAGP